MQDGIALDQSPSGGDSSPIMMWNKLHQVVEHAGDQSNAVKHLKSNLSKPVEGTKRLSLSRSTSISG